MNIREKELPLLVITGPTATGKTHLAAKVAYRLGGEIISADSRQVYKRMNLGTGKDYDDYLVNSVKIPCHLIDLYDPGYRYNIFEYQQDFLKVYQDLSKRGKLPVVCGGSGLYIETIIQGYRLVQVPVNEEKRRSWNELPDQELVEMLVSIKKQHNTTDIGTRKRLIRALEIAEFERENPEYFTPYPKFHYTIAGIRFERDEIRNRITARLKKRLQEGMVEEVRDLLQSGIAAEDLVYYGLEYKYLTLYLTGQIPYDEMFNRLNIAIHQFSKRQMTWFRKMERSGIPFQWIEGEKTEEEKLNEIILLAEAFLR